jgi:anion-transporting  ArsA/GET3 family ATPase
VQALLDRKLLVVTGKGGVGKTTVAVAIGLVAASRGRRTIVVEMGEQSRLPTLFGAPPPASGMELLLQERLSTVSIDPDRALLEWLQALGGRISGRVLASSGTFQYFAAAAPGAKELVSMMKIWQLTREGAGRRRGGDYDLVVLDAPATGHALGLLGSPQTFGAIARVGPIAGHARQVRELLEDPTRSAYLAVALATEMAVTEALELEQGLQRQLDRGLSAVIVNGLLPKRFTTAELARIATLDGDAPGVTQAAVAAAHSIHERARFQQNQLARLRRRDFDVVSVPFAWSAELDLAAVREIAARLERKL